MSTWTHVNGCIRVDGLPGLTDFSIEKVKEIIGPACLFDDWNEETTIPCGSEGSLDYLVIEYDDGMPWLAIPIWGDLRDYDDVEEVKRWFIELCGKLPSPDYSFIRQAVIQIEVEGRDPVICTHHDIPEQIA